MRARHLNTAARHLGTALAAASIVLASACSDGGADHDSPSGDGATTTPGTANTDGAGAGVPAPRAGRSDAPAATFDELTGGKGLYLLTAQTGPDLDAAHYSTREYAASGTAARYTTDGSSPADGRLHLTAGDTADFRTRVVVRRPDRAADFNGTLVVEWLNVSSGGDAAPDYTYLADELVRRGYAWAGVSAQRIGIEGGAVAVPVDVGIDTGAGKGIKHVDPDRYGSLAHPGDAFSYDLFTQVSRGLRLASAGSPLDGLDVTSTLAVGESQSAFALTTYANGVQPLSQEFDGVLIHSRGGASMPLGEPGTGVDITSTILGAATTIRTDLTIPVFVVQTETDVVGVLNYLPARQPDTDRLRVWEIAGTAHADHYQIGGAEPALGCSAPINDGQQVFVLRAALRALDRWARGGDAPPPAEPLKVETSGPTPVLTTDVVGNALGGVRTPVVDAATQVLSGLPSAGGGIACMLMGSTTPLPAAALAATYPDPDSYTAAYRDATDEAIDAGFLLEDDRAAVIADARPGGSHPG